MAFISSGGGISPPIVSNGIISGLDTKAIIQALMQSYLQPVKNLQAEQSSFNAQSADYQAINTDLLALQTAAQALNTSSGWGARKATSSNTAVATAVAASGTPTGSVTFNVLAVASANSQISSGSVAATSVVVDSNPTFLLAQGGAQYGLSTIAAGVGLTQGAHTVSVTQASQAASDTGTIDLKSQTAGIVVGASSNTLNVTVNSIAYTLTLAASPGGGYSGSGLLSAVQSAITAAGASGTLQAGFNSSGQLTLATVNQGSTQTLQVTGGNALPGLGLTAMALAAKGADGVVTVDGKANTLSTVTPGGTVSFAAGGGGTISAQLVASSTQAGVTDSLLSAGTLTATNVSVGNGSLAAVVANINSAGTGIIASAVQTGTKQFILQLSSSTTGTAANLSVDSNAFSSSALGPLVVAQAGSNAQIQVGGGGGYTISSQNDTFAGLLPGLSVTVASTSTGPVTITVNPDATAAEAAVSTLTDAANTALGDISKYSGYDQATKRAGPLMGSSLLRDLTNQVLGIFATTSGTSTLGNAKNVGLSLSNGTIAFDKTTFEAAFASNPNQVANLFTQGGSFAPSLPAYNSGVAFSYASSTTRPGAYAVSISHSATQATDVGATLAGGKVSTAETLTVASGGLTVNYATTAGESLASVASGINGALAGAGIALSAQVIGGGNQLELTSSTYGTAAAFQITSTNTSVGTTGLAGPTAGTPASFAGLDVAGTINGVAATGSGQFLNAPVTDPTLGGLSLLVSTAGIISTTNLGTFTYSPGIAQRLSSLTSVMSDASTGQITTTAKGLTQEATGLNPQIAFYTMLSDQEHTALQNEFSRLEVTLGSLKNQSSALTSALAQLG